MTEWNGFKGRAKRLDDIDLPKIGAIIGVGEDEIHAVMDVEAAGSGFDKQGRPRILFERHWFHRNLKAYAPEKLSKAVNAGLAVQNWSRATYGKDQYELLERAMKIDERCALMSASWGLGQVMGFNHRLAGYRTVQAFVIDMMDDEENHLRAMIEFIKSAKLDKHLRSHDWAAFARGYNGPSYKKNLYDTKLANAYAKWSKIRDTPYEPSDEDFEKAIDEALKEMGDALPSQEPAQRDLPDQGRMPPETSPRPSPASSGVKSVLWAGAIILAAIIIFNIAKGLAP